MTLLHFAYTTAAVILGNTITAGVILLVIHWDDQRRSRP